MASEDLFDEANSEDILKIIGVELEAIDDFIEDSLNIQVDDLTEPQPEDINEINNVESTTPTTTTIPVQNNDNKSTENISTRNEIKLIQLPLSRIRGLMKLDPDMSLASTEAVFAVAKATEMFIESLARESYTFTAQSKKKTMQKRDVDLTISSVDSLMFLEGALNFN